MKRVLMGFALVCAGLAILSFYLWQQDRKRPRFQEKTVAQWIRSSPIRPGNEVVNAFGTSALPELIDMLERKEDLFHRMATTVWKKLPSNIQERFRGLEPVHLDSAQRAAAAWLGKLGPDADHLLPRLGRFVSEQGKFVGMLAVVGKNHPDAPRMIAELLQHTNSMVQDQAALAAAVFEERALPMLPGLTNLLLSHPKGAPYNALLGIGYIGPQASNAVPLLISLLERTNLIPNTLSALHGIGPGAVEAAPKLCNLLEEVSGREELKILDCIRRMGHGAQYAVPVLLQRRSADANLMQLLISLSLSELQEDRKMAVAALAKALRERKIVSEGSITVAIPDERTTLGSWHGLGKGQFAALMAADYPDAPELLPLLKEALKDNPASLSILSARAIWRHTRSPDEVLPTVTDALLSDHDLSVHYAIEVLGEMPLDRSQLGPLIEFYQDMKRPWQQRMAVLKTIKRADPEFPSDSTLAAVP